MKLIKEIKSFINELKDNYLVSNIIKSIPDFTDKVADFFTTNTIKDMADHILNKTQDEVMKKKKKEVLDFIIAIWDYSPNALRLKLAILLYSSYIVTNELYMFIVANGLIIAQRFIDKEFDYKIREHIKQLTNG